jgi:AcrR family transcriptional regulator
MQTAENAAVAELPTASKRNEMILAVATKIFARRGYRNTDVQEIADELGIGKGTIYRAFGTKEELFLATVDNGMKKLSERVQKVKEEQCESSDHMRLSILTFLKFFDENPDLIELLMQERSEFKHRDTHSYARHWEINLPIWTDRCREAIGHGRLRDLPVEGLLEVYSGLCYGAIFIQHFSKKHVDLEARAELMADIIQNGVLSEEERTRLNAEKTR